MERDSPFFALRKSQVKVIPNMVHVNFCNICHYVWKAPAEAKQCINCTNKNTARSLVNYKTEAPIT